MPYIKKSKRFAMNRVVQAMHDAGVKADGDLNYILFKYCKESVEAGYGNFKNFIAELNETGHEIRRRFLAPYEDIKIDENGDV